MNCLFNTITNNDVIVYEIIINCDQIYKLLHLKVEVTAKRLNSYKVQSK